MLSLIFSAFIACSDSAKDCPQTECPKCPDAAASSTISTKSSSAGALSAAEKELLSSHIEDLRAGIRGFDENSIGICVQGAKKSECAEYLGTDAKNLPEGKYIMYAKLTAPKIAPEGKWKVEFSKDCTRIKKTKNGESKTTNNYSKSYNINFGPKGYRLAPLATIASPGKHGSEECTWSLKFHNVNGVKEVTGSWSLPEKE